MKSGVIENDEEKLEMTSYVLFREPNTTEHRWRKYIPRAVITQTESAIRFKKTHKLLNRPYLLLHVQKCSGSVKIVNWSYSV